MKTPTKFTFKTEKSTGHYRSFYPDNHYIKIKNVRVGAISDTAPYKIRLQVIKSDILEDGNPNCDWKWIQLRKESTTLQEAKDWLNDNFEILMKKYKIKNH
jgi:hypothetical protein